MKGQLALNTVGVALITLAVVVLVILIARNIITGSGETISDQATECVIQGGRCAEGACDEDEEVERPYSCRSKAADPQRACCVSTAG